MLPVTGPAQPVLEQSVIHTCRSLCWACMCAERTSMCTKTGFLPTLGLGEGQLKSQSSQRSTLVVKLSDLKVPPWNFSCCLCQPSQPSSASSELPTSHIVLKWLLLPVLGYKTSWLFRIISPQFTCNSRFVLRGRYCSFPLTPLLSWVSFY